MLGSMNPSHQAVPASLRNCFPDRPEIAGGSRVEDEGGTANQVLCGHIVVVRPFPTVGGMVAVVAHREIAALGYGEDLGVVERIGIALFYDGMADAVRQRLDVAHEAVAVFVDPILDALSVDRLVVDIEDAVLDLDAVAGQADDPLDIVGLAVLRPFEDDDVAALHGPLPDAALERRPAEREGV